MGTLIIGYGITIIHDDDSLKALADHFGITPLRSDLSHIKETRDRLREALAEKAPEGVFMDHAAQHGKVVTMIFDQETMKVGDLDMEGPRNPDHAPRLVPGGLYELSRIFDEDMTWYGHVVSA